jgi:anti-sigma factor ChrR (cupin superfamily)
MAAEHAAAALWRNGSMRRAPWGWRARLCKLAPAHIQEPAMDAKTPVAANDDLKSHHVRVANLAWQKTRFPGCEVKTLLFDRDSGLVTALMRFAPGAVLPDHEHVKIEQTYVIEGTLVDREGPDTGLAVGKGDFVWRPAGSRHSAWCPDGGLMLAIFQVPNRFFERDGRVTDLGGGDWDALWGTAAE